jgi:hypothetical protein
MSAAWLVLHYVVVCFLPVEACILCCCLPAMVVASAQQSTLVRCKHQLYWKSCTQIVGHNFNRYVNVGGFYADAQVCVRFASMPIYSWDEMIVLCPRVHFHINKFWKVLLPPFSFLLTGIQWGD